MEGEKLVYICPNCNASFTRASNRDRHIIRMHNNEEIVYECHYCEMSFDNVENLESHKTIHQRSTSFKVTKSAFKKDCVIYRKIFKDTVKTIEQAYLKYSNELYNLLDNELLSKSYFKCTVTLVVEFIKLDPSDNIIEDSIQFYLVSGSLAISNREDIENLVHKSRANFHERADDFVNNGSGWILNDILYLDVQIGNCAPLTGNCSKLTILYKREMKKISFKKVSKKDDNKCFLYAIAYYFKKTENMDILNKFIKEKLNVNIVLPVSIKDIKKFEDDNKHLNFKINVLHSKGEEIYPLYRSANTSKKHCINLMLYKVRVKDTNYAISHFMFVKNVSKLLLRKYKKSYKKNLFCFNCLNGFRYPKLLEDHEQYCLQNKPCKVIGPKKEDRYVKFDNFKNKFKLPYIGFFDFEAVLSKPDILCESCQFNKEDKCKHKSKIENYQKPITFSLIITDEEKNVIHTKTYTGEDCVSVLISELLSIEPILLEEMEKNMPMIMTEKDQKTFRNATICHICEKTLNDDKVRGKNT